MLHDLKISRLAVICVLCAAVVPSAHAAASVRTLGGAGTYSSASSASSAKATGNAGGTSAARAGSVRVSPTSAVKSSAVSGTTSATTSANRSASTQRLSIGKYLGNANSVSGGSSVRPGGTTGGTGGGTTDPGLTGELRSEIDQLQRDVDSLRDSINDKQEAVTFGDYLIMDGNDVYVDIDALRSEFGDTQIDIDFMADDTGLSWFDGKNWNLLVEWANIPGIRGEKGDKGDKGDPGETPDMSNYATLERLNTELAAAVNGLVTSGQLTAALADMVTRAELGAYATTDMLDAKANAEDVYTKAEVYNKAEVDTKIEGIVVGNLDGLEQVLEGKATKEYVDAELDKKADVDASYTKYESDKKYLTEHQSLDGYAKTEDIPTIPTDVSAFNNDAGYLTEHQSLDGLATTVQLADKADKSELDAYAKKDELPTVPTKVSELENDANYVTADTVYTKEQVNEKVADIIAGSVDGLGALASKDQVNTGDIANGAVTKEKLSAAVQDTLDNAVSMDGVDMSKNQVLAVYDGQKTWLEIVEDVTE